MQFKEWLKAKNIKQSEAAKHLQIDKGRLNRILSGEERPTLMQVSDIYDYTKKKVTFWDWIEQQKELSK